MPAFAMPQRAIAQLLSCSLPDKKAPQARLHVLLRSLGAQAQKLARAISDDELIVRETLYSSHSAISMKPAVFLSLATYLIPMALCDECGVLADALRRIRADIRVTRNPKRLPR
jgi:hypothetical protein